MKHFRKRKLLVGLGVILLLILVGLLYAKNYLDERALTIQPDYSNNRPITELNNAVVVDFSQCTPDKRRIFVEQGSATIAVFGRSGNFCNLRLGEEIENPNWDGTLPTECAVPISKGKVIFAKNSYGVDFQEIHQYCSGQ